MLLYARANAVPYILWQFISDPRLNGAVVLRFCPEPTSYPRPRRYSYLSARSALLNSPFPRRNRGYVAGSLNGQTVGTLRRLPQTPTEPSSSQ